MRIVIAVLVPLLLLAACGNNEEIATKKAEYDKIKAELKALNQQKGEKAKEWNKVTNRFIPAAQTLKRALASGDKDAAAAAQANYDQVQAENDAVMAEKNDLNGRISKLQRRKKKLVEAIQLLGGGNLEP